MAAAIVLLSGGMDSTTTLALAKSQGFSISGLTFSYGQRHSVEVERARRIAEAYAVDELTVVEIDLRVFGQSALTDNLPLAKDRTLAEMTASIPSTYVPARNTIFLSYALAFAEVRQAFDIFIGVNSLDYSGYPDCRPVFISAFQEMANLATAQSVRSGRAITIHAPLIEKTKADIVRLGLKLGVDYAATISCYEASDDCAACGHCDACILRRQAFEECGVTDPTRYRDSVMVET